MGQLESIGFIRANKLETARRLKPSDLPQVKPVDPRIGQWHTVKITMIGRTLSAELDGQLMIDRYEYPTWLLSTEAEQLRFQKHRFLENPSAGERNPCPIEFRNIFFKEIESSESVEAGELNVPPPGFTALFNGKDLTGWHTSPEALRHWFVEDGVLKSPGLVEHYRASLVTQKHYRDFILLVDFRMPTISDSGICFRRLIPKIQGFGDMEQFNLRSRGGMGHLESYYFLPNGIARRMKLKEEEEPHVRHIDPEVGAWHTVKLTMRGRNFSAEYDGEVILKDFRFHDGMMNLEPAPILMLADDMGWNDIGCYGGPVQTRTLDRLASGGGFRDIWIDREGHDLAIWLKGRGITSLVLKYRTRPEDLGASHAWRDYQRAVRAIYPGIPDGIDKLIEARGSPESSSPGICPMFMINARVDRLTPVDKCLEFYTRLVQVGVHAELHVFAKGSHGFDLGTGRGESLALWPMSFIAWLRDCGIVEKLEQQRRKPN